MFFDSEGEKISTAGFDAVVGNPPYVRMEQIKPLKEFLSSQYTVHGERVDLYAYFIEKSLELTSGVYGVIVSNKWTKSEYGEGVRSILSDSGLETFIDFGDLEVFKGVSTYPSILVVNQKHDSDDSIQIAKFDNLEFSDLAPAVSDRGYTIPRDSLDSGKWALGTAQEELLLNSIENAGKPLLEHPLVEDSGVKDGIGWGIKTGGNDAFIIDSNTREDLIHEDPRSEDLIKPLLKGKDINRYLIEDRDRYLIYTKKGTSIEEYPAIKSHLEQYREKIGNTATSEEWYELQQAQAKYENHFKSEKICYPDISKETSFAQDSEGVFLANTCYFIPSDSYALLGVLNSAVINWYYKYMTSEYRGGYQRSFTHAIKNIPIPQTIDSEEIEQKTKQISTKKEQRNRLNLELQDYLSGSNFSLPLNDIGLTQPVKRSKSPLGATKSELDNLRIGTATVDRESPNTVLIKATARYKPDDEDAYETDRWGYTETESLPAFRITDLSEREADLIEHFVPVAVDEAGGFANFRETATKTNSLIDRLKAIELPDVDDVADDLENYLKTKERAEELDEKIERTDRLIDEIVYELYGLTDEEIEIVEEAVGE